MARSDPSTYLLLMFLVNFAEDNGMKKVFFCNIPVETTQEELEEYYSAYDVSEVYIPLDSSTDQTRRFASITMPQEEAAKSIIVTNGTSFQSHTFAISEPLLRGKKAPPVSTKSARSSMLATSTPAWTMSKPCLKNTAK